MPLPENPVKLIAWLDFSIHFFLIRLRDKRVWRRYGNLLIWIFRNDVVLLVREAEAQHCAALVRASAARREEESGAGLVWRNFAEGFQVPLSKT